MALAEALSRREAPASPSFFSPARMATACGITLGFVILILSERPTRWLVFATVGTLLGVLLAIGHVRRQLLMYFIVGLSLNVHYYITQPEPFMWIGISGPTWFSVPLVL